MPIDQPGMTGVGRYGLPIIASYQEVMRDRLRESRRLSSMHRRQ
jgi:hypothetical protein